MSPEPLKSREPFDPLEGFRGGAHVAVVWMEV